MQTLHRMTACFLHKSSGRRQWRGRCAWLVRRLYSSHALKALLPTLCLATVVIYSLADKLRNFVASIFIPQYHYQYPVALCFGQVLVSLLFLNLLHVLGLAPLRRYHWSLGERLLVPAVCEGVGAVLSTWATATGSSYGGCFPLATSLLPLLTLGLSFVLKLAVPPSVHISVLVSILSGSSVIFAASRGVSSAEPLDYMYAPLAVLLHALALTWLVKVAEGERRRSPEARASVFDIYYNQLVNQVGVLGLLWLLHPDAPWQVLRQGSWRTLLFHGYLLAILLLGMAMNFMVGVSALCVSPLAAGLLHSARQLVQPFIQLL